MAGGRPKGLPKTGGRVKGTPNKCPEFKARLKQISMAYFGDACVEEIDPQTKQMTGRMITEFERDFALMKSSDRVNAMLALMKYHTPQMQATSVDVTIDDSGSVIADRLSRLAGGEEITSEAEE